MKICFLVELPKSCYPFMWQWRDGLYAAMKILEEEHQVTYHLDGKCHCSPSPDFLMVWGGTLSRPYNNSLSMKGFKILLFAGGNRDPSLFQPFNITCFENDLHTNEAKAHGVKCITAFGTNTQVFKPFSQLKVFDVIYPGAFGLWKRKDLFAKAVKGLKAFTFGNIQYHELECLNVCVENGVLVSADLPQEVLPYFYAMSKSIVVLPVPQIGGQRTVLEAMAMKIPIIVPSDAPLVCEFAKHGGIIVDPMPEKIREAVLNADKLANTEKAYNYVMENLTEVHYAKALKKALSII